jgi:hypothetical protein
MMLTGGCHCGKVRFSFAAEGVRHALCHCGDCRRHAGAPVVGWALVPKASLKVEGDVSTYASSENGRRQFCPVCGTSLFYRNDAIFPDHIDVQSATLDEPAALPPEAQIQVAERIDWMKTAHELPEFERYPG